MPGMPGIPGAPGVPPPPGQEGGRDKSEVFSECSTFSSEGGWRSAVVIVPEDNPTCPRANGLGRQGPQEFLLRPEKVEAKVARAATQARLQALAHLDYVYSSLLFW